MMTPLQSPTVSSQHDITDDIPPRPQRLAVDWKDIAIVVFVVICSLCFAFRLGALFNYILYVKYLDMYNSS